MTVRVVKRNFGFTKRIFCRNKGNWSKEAVGRSLVQKAVRVRNLRG
jgi:hypothetical protein